MINMKKKITKIIALGLLLGGLATSSAMAEGNIRDTDFHFGWGIIHGSSNTGQRQKLDATSAYMKCISMSKGYDYLTSVMANGRNLTYGSRQRFTAGTTHYLPNTVYETYGSGTYTYIQGSTGIINVTRPDAYGVWSPDSI